MKFESKNLAVALRRKGFSYRQILEQVKVSKGTLSVWLSEIELTAAQKAKIASKMELGRIKSAETKRRQKFETISKITAEAKREFSQLLKNELFLVGLSLYWAEGDKHRGERVKFTNSDPQLVKIMMRWFRETCGVHDKKFRVALHIHNLLVSSSVKKFWSELTKIPPNQFNKIYIKQTSLRQRRKVLYNGTCGIVVSDRALFRRISGWKLAAADHFLSSSSNG